MSTRAIQVENLGKLYHLGNEASQHGIADMFMPWRRIPSPNEFWAIKNVSFNIEHGESVGIIGRNGAGKSTLLKILSRITAPTTGRVRVCGRVGTLLEVGTGFHPELSGRDNIFLSGTILGLRYDEVKKRLDEIIGFSGVEKFIDTPVKRYSSGMQVKLAFAVALYLEPEILIVDEVLAVGDLAFQRKSLNRLNEVTGRDGRTVLFVSHSLEAVKKSCARTIVLENGELKFDGPSEDGVDFYRDSIPFEPETVKNSNMKDRLNRTSGEVRFTNFEAFDKNGERSWRVNSGDPVRFRIAYEVLSRVESLYVIFRILTGASSLSVQDQQIVSNISIRVSDEPVKAGKSGVVEVVLPRLMLRRGDFSLYVVAGNRDDSLNYDIIDDNVNLPVLSVRTDSKLKSDRIGVVDLEYRSSLQ